jgi:DNA-binding NarL/FixJ family response regulator
MPAPDGEHVLRELVRFDPAASVVMVSGHVDPLVERKLRGVGARAVVRKPWTTTELLAAIVQSAGEPPEDEARNTYVVDPTSGAGEDLGQALAEPAHAHGPDDPAQREEGAPQDHRRE